MKFFIFTFKGVENRLHRVGKHDLAPLSLLNDFTHTIISPRLIIKVILPFPPLGIFANV